MSEADRIALARLERTNRVQSMIDVLAALLAGRMTRGDVREWITRDWPQRRDIKLSGDADAVLNGLWSIDDEADDGRLFVGENELRAYLAALRRGAAFIGTGEPLLRLAVDVDAFAERVGGEPIHWWEDGFGWVVEVRFGARASGRAFVAMADARTRDSVGIGIRRGDPWREALIDVFEDLAIDERDATWLHPDVDLAQLPEWALWREDDNANRVEIERSHCFAKLDLHERTLRERGHKQFYWVDPVE